MTNDPFLKFFLLPLVGIILITGAVVMVSHSNEREYLEKKGHTMGCEFIGKARNLNQVAFYDCGGIIKMERIR